MIENLAKSLLDRAEKINWLLEGSVKSETVPTKFLLIDASLLIEAAGRLEGYEARIERLRGGMP